MSSGSSTHLHIVCLVKNQDCLLPADAQPGAGLGVDQVVVGQEDDVGGGGHAPANVDHRGRGEGGDTRQGEKERNSYRMAGQGKGGEGEVEGPSRATAVEAMQPVTCIGSAPTHLAR